MSSVKPSSNQMEVDRMWIQAMTADTATVRATTQSSKAFGDGFAGKFEVADSRFGTLISKASDPD